MGQRDISVEGEAAMIWKLFATVLAVSDNGSIATSGFVTDYPTEIDCKQTADDLFRTSEHVVNGLKIIFKTNAVCRRVLPPQLPSQRQIQISPFGAPFFGMTIR